jgi:putative hemolysin
MLLNEGTESGVFEEAEADIIERTLRLDDKKANSLMTNRNDIVWIDINASAAEIKMTLLQQTYSYFPVCDKTLDTVVGVIRSEELLLKYLSSEEISLHPLLHKPVFIPEGVDALSVLELFKTSGVHVAIVVDEYGSVQGLVSMNDILEAIVGDLPTANEPLDQEIVQREDGSWLVDGLTTIDDFKEYFGIRKLKEEDEGDFQTVGGFVMHELHRIPMAGDTFVSDNFCYEVVDMDGNRVDKVLVVKSSL